MIAFSVKCDYKVKKVISNFFIVKVNGHRNLSVSVSVSPHLSQFVASIPIHGEGKLATFSRLILIEIVHVHSNPTCGKAEGFVASSTSSHSGESKGRGNSFWAGNEGFRHVKQSILGWWNDSTYNGIT